MVESVCSLYHSLENSNICLLCKSVLIMDNQVEVIDRLEIEVLNSHLPSACVKYRVMRVYMNNIHIAKPIRVFVLSTSDKQLAEDIVTAYNLLFQQP